VPSKKLEEYPYPDKRNTRKISLEFNKKRLFKSRSVVLDEFVSSQIGLVDQITIENHINSLTSFHNRHSKSHYINEVAQWIRNELSNFGYSEEELFYHEYTEQGYQLNNVICIKNGNNNRIILLCAHYDTILDLNRADTLSRAPGADDNASGVAALLEIAKIMHDIKTEYTIQFVFFSGEEQGYWGSKHYAQKMKDENQDMVVVVNLDMCGETGFLANDKTTFIDIDEGTYGIHPHNNEPSQIFGQRMEQMAKDYTDLDIEFDPINASDYMPFEAREYVCIGAYDGSAETHNPHYHSSTDVPSNLNLVFLTSVTKMVLSFLLTESHYLK
jgi:hypothetical protein